MPAIFTHVQFGKEVAATLPAPLKALVESHKESFYLGTQGPDLLFYHKPLKKKNNPVRQKGWDLHAESPEGFFLRAASLLLADEKNFQEGKFLPTTADAAYVLGFLCHFTLDRQCHPSVDAHSVDGLTHGKIESEFDKYQFRKIGRKPRGFNAATLFFPIEESKAASAKILNVPEQSTERALKSMRTINRLFSHKCGFVHGFCHALLTVVGMNRSFGDMFLHKKEDRRCAELLPKLSEQFNEAIPLAQEIICDFFENLPDLVAENSLKKDFFRCNYSGVTE